MHNKIKPNHNPLVKHKKVNTTEYRKKTKYIIEKLTHSITLKEQLVEELMPPSNSIASQTKVEDALEQIDANPSLQWNVWHV